MIKKIKMLTYLELNNFKSHSNTSLELSNLNILSGINGTGKSSIIQSLLLLRQSYLRGVLLNTGLTLNGSLCEIGNGEDALYLYAEDDIITFKLKDDKFSTPLSLAFDTSDAYQEDLIPLSENLTNIDLQNCSLFNNHFQYLSADRWSAKDSYPSSTLEVKFRKQLSLQKGQGELTAHFLDVYGSTLVTNEHLLHPSTSNRDLLSQCSAWLSEISPNVNTKIHKIGNEYEIRYEFNVENNLPTKPFRAQNVGFGISYTLSIIVAILSAQKGSLIIVENPEAHIHPSGQSNLMRLITLAAQHGVQFLIETHSDHVINSILLGCKQYERNQTGIQKEKVKLFFFDRDNEQHTTLVETISIINGGKIDKQPNGFFDQLEKDLENLMGF